ncbi:glycoside hydrolase [Sinomicrobium weinanense]|uniref:Glycosyl hydrolase n=1 Tax=Sinomicrobium weinanense TaxID=2842200 RepID=A0A926JNC2_9FLAO|nr:glycoside hydrolase [Sinomicrobium weinanense]MBC9794458.1 glycosyl hydrolase [Sinomicrobium weinanense]MBU3124365.1 hypothetical protein [Sinomicrobium weinanense]
MNSKKASSVSSWILSVSLLAISCADKEMDELGGAEHLTFAAADTLTTSISLDWGQTYQQIDGFGAFGGRITPFFESPKRDSIMEYLWGQTGLKLNMLRGKVLHTYPFDQESRTVTIKPANVSIDVDTNGDVYQGLSDEEKEHLGQVWILKKARERYNVPVVFASTWTPPLYMKKDPTNISATNFNGLDYSTSSTAFARYVAGFAKAFKEEGIEFYGISPSNEPENVFSSWDASYWTPRHLGEFISNNLRPALNEEGLQDMKIISSENAAWGTANTFLSTMDKSNVDILAGHGYVEIGDIILGKRGLNQNPSIWTYATGNKPVWVTEASDDSGVYDNTMTGGIKLATNMHKLLAECNVNAYVYWLGMLAIRNNESLICTNSDGTLDFPRTYDVMGHYSRDITDSYYRFKASVDQGSGLMVSAYKEPGTGKFTVVVINSGDNAVNAAFDLSGFEAGELNSYQTTDHSAGHWNEEAPMTTDETGKMSALFPPQSITTLTGTKQ